MIHICLNYKSDEHLCLQEAGRAEEGYLNLVLFSLVLFSSYIEFLQIEPHVIPPILTRMQTSHKHSLHLGIFLGCSIAVQTRNSRQS